MCMRGIVQPVVGAVCPICSSTVERILEVALEVKPRPARKRKDCSIRVEPQESELGSETLECPAGIRLASDSTGFCQAGSAPRDFRLLEGK